MRWFESRVYTYSFLVYQRNTNIQKESLNSTIILTVDSFFLSSSSDSDQWKRYRLTKIHEKFQFQLYLVNNFIKWNETVNLIWFHEWDTILKYKNNELFRLQMRKEHNFWKFQEIGLLISIQLFRNFDSISIHARLSNWEYSQIIREFYKMSLWRNE